MPRKRPGRLKEVRGQRIQNPSDRKEGITTTNSDAVRFVPREPVQKTTDDGEAVGDSDW